MALTEKQTRFALEYIKDFNAVQAAIRAGYKQKNIQAYAWEILKSVKPYIDHLLFEQRRKIKMDADTVKERLTEFAEDPTCPKSIRLKATELLGKTLSMFTDVVKHEGDLEIIVSLPKKETDEANN